MKEGLHKIGEVAELLVTSVRTIRYYEEEGLLTPIRTERGTRLYSERHIARLRIILRLAKIGLPLEAIRTVAQVREQSTTGSASSQQVQAHLKTLRNGIEAQISELRQLMEEVDQSKRIVSGCRNCQNMPSSVGCPDCPVRKNLDQIELLNLVWDTDSPDIS